MFCIIFYFLVLQVVYVSSLAYKLHFVNKQIIKIKKTLSMGLYKFKF